MITPSRRWDQRAAHCAAALVALALLPIGSLASETSPYLIDDLYAEPNPLIPTPGFPRIDRSVALAGDLYFAASDGIHGRELWRTDGTVQGTFMVHDICPGFCASEPDGLTVLGDELFFSAWDGETGIELWKTDGSSVGTVRVADIAPGPDSSYPRGFGQLNGVLFFPADGGRGEELWRTDGTEAGTFEVVDLEPGVVGSRPGIPIATGGVAVFRAAVGGVANLYRTDGTAAGTSPLGNVVPFGGDLDYGIYQWGTAGGLVFFRGDDGSGVQLWRTDGTAGGTFAVTDEPFNFASRFAAVGGKLIFGADGVNGDEPWVSDGTLAGTFELLDIYPGSRGCGPWNQASAADGVFFACTSPQYGRELWFTDGTTAGTRMVKDIVPGAGGGFFTAPFLDTFRFASTGDRVVFFVDEGPTLGVNPWSSDGTDAGTVRLPGSERGVSYHLVAPGSSRVVLWTRSADLPELRVTDGTVGGTETIGTLHSQSSSFPDRMLQLGPGRTLLRSWVEDPVVGAKWKNWLVDDQGVISFVDAFPELDNGGIFFPIPAQIGSRLYFEFDQYFSVSGLHSTALDLTDFRLETPTYGWVSRVLGTNLLRRVSATSSTDPILEIYNPSTTQTLPVFGPNPLVWPRDQKLEWLESNGSLFLPSDLGGLWEIEPGGDSTNHLPATTNVDSLAGASSGAVFASAETPGSGREPWSYDPRTGLATEISVAPGTVSGMYRPKRLARWPRIGGFWDSDDTYGTTVFSTSMRNRYFFAGTDGISGIELWSTPPGGPPQLLADIAPGAASSFPRDLVVSGNQLFFRADDGAHGTELWVTDGTPAGTMMLEDARPGPASSLPQDLRAVAGDLVYSAYDDANGRELWFSDGTPGGTRRLADIASGSLSSSPAAFHVTENRILFTANDGVRGFELWAIDLPIVQDSGGIFGTSFEPGNLSNWSFDYP